MQIIGITLVIDHNSNVGIVYQYIVQKCHISDISLCVSAQYVCVRTLFSQFPPRVFVAVYDGGELEAQSFQVDRRQSKIGLSILAVPLDRLHRNGATSC